MKDLITYLNQNQFISFKDKPFTEIDAMILAQLSYLNFERIIEKDFCPLLSLKDQAEQLTEGNYAKNRNKELLEILCNSSRYSIVEIGEVEALLNDSIQYAAMTFRIEGIYFIVYRGTDMSIAGWKEDLNLGVSGTIESHHLGLEYANHMFGEYDGDFYLIGHSKGGNIALYVGMNLENQFQDRLQQIINFDGPGFSFELNNSSTYLRIKEKHIKFIPKDDVIGLLLNHSDAYHVVDSKSIGVLQHDLYFWKIENDSFKKLNDISVLSKIFNKTILDWLDSMSMEDKIECVNAADEFFKKANITNLNQLKKLSFVAIKGLISSSIHLPFKQKKMFASLMFRLVKYYLKNSVSQIQKKEEPILISEETKSFNL